QVLDVIDRHAEPDAAKECAPVGPVHSDLLNDTLRRDPEVDRIRAIDGESCWLQDGRGAQPLPLPHAQFVEGLAEVTAPCGLAREDRGGEIEPCVHVTASFPSARTRALTRLWARGRCRRVAAGGGGDTAPRCRGACARSRTRSPRVPLRPAPPTTRSAVP